MPLPRIKKFCCATCKATGVACLNPAAFGQTVCRYHGARPPKSIQRGADHGRYKTGEYTQAAKAHHRATIVRLALLEELGFRIGMVTGNRTPGRKIKGGLIPANSLRPIAELQILLALTPEQTLPSSKNPIR